MKVGTWMLFGSLLCLPAPGLTQEPRSAIPLATAITPTSQPAPQSSAKPEFDLRNSSVQGVIRANARAAAAPSQPQSAQNLPVNFTLAAGAMEQQGVPFRAPRRTQRLDCGLSDCVAYDADGDALFTVPREQYVGTRGKTAADEWLSCQSSNDLLTTFERYDKCRGVSIGLPLKISDSDIILKLPLIH
jgi:hypothetical protein